ncbi:hypothetical protein CBS101457_004131 [Exobasidium rhododendri]|nr:hypothetical protein CBS101457_004131 [Exobasidium rhododendri]
MELESGSVSTGPGSRHGHDSTDSSYAASSQGQSQGQASLNSTATTSRQTFTNNGIDSLASPRRKSSKPLSQQENFKLQRNGPASSVAKEGSDQVEEDLWSSILNSVKSSRAVPVKNIVMLGESRTGKSTILSQLCSISPSSSLSPQSKTIKDGPSGEKLGDGNREFVAELGLGYSFFDVGDEDGEEIIARVGVYQASSSDSAHLSLLPFALATPMDALPSNLAHVAENHTTSKTRTSKSSGEGQTGHAHVDTKPKPSIEALRDSLFLITLDWETPWTFLSQLIEWLDVVREVVEDASHSGGASWSREGAIWEEMKESLERSVRAYADPLGHTGTVLQGEEDETDIGNTSTASAIMAVSNPAAAMGGNERNPLPEGCLTHNLGVPLVIVCTKADTIIQLERDRNFKEEQFDYIQQVLRTVCLKYGASLFFTAQSKAPSFEILRSYVLHQLFSHGNSSGTNSDAFAFSHRASTVERDVLLVPAGWDSFGKIKALRDGFDCAGMANGWEWDVQVEKVRRRQGLPKGSEEAENIAAQQVDRHLLPGLINGGAGGVDSALKLYEDIIEDWDASAPPLAINSRRVKQPDDQDFLLQHYSHQQKEPEARVKLTRHGSSSTEVSGTLSATTKSVVGPMGSSSLSLPSVERALQERQQDDESRTSKSSSRKEGPGARDREREQREKDASRSTPGFRNTLKTNTSALQSPSLNSSDKGGSSRPTSPSGNAQAGLQTPKQSEVLHSFFQSLLKEKGTTSATGSTRSSTSRGTPAGERKNAS